MSIADRLNQYFEQEFQGRDSAVFRDLMLNFRKVLEEGQLNENDRWAALSAIGEALDDKTMVGLANERLTTLGESPEAIKEIRESAAIMGMLNTYYKFKGYLSPESAADYTRAGLRMNSLAKPTIGKDRFEMLAFAVSVVNGCPTCISSHEKTLRGHGIDAEKIHDLARLASVSKGLSTLRNIG